MARIACVGCLAALAVAGCGGSAGTRAQTHAGLPRALARLWEKRASTIAAAAAAGDGCRAQQLADSLRNDVIASARRISPSLREPLLSGVNALADRIACTPPARTVTVQPQRPPGPPKKPHGHGRGHGHGQDHGGNQGNQ